MRSFYRSLSGPLRRSIALVCLADAVVAVAFGAVTASAGLPIWLPVALSLAVFAGAAQFLFVAVLAAAVLVNTRLVPLSLAVADVLGPGRLRTVAGGHLVTDESVAFANAERDERGRRAAFWGCGVALFTVWNAGVLLGTVAGRHVPDAAALGLDAAFPAVLLALVMPALRDRATLRTALVGAVIAVASAPFLPAGLPVLLALVALPLVRSAS
jgi:predicted branched-subunit amino acid permease